jgi:hypothetical protein
VWLRALPAGPAIASAFNQTALTVCQFPGNADVAGLCGEATLHFPTYDGTTFDKTGDGTGGAVKTAVDFTTQFESLQWKSTAAITRMSIFLAGAGNLLAGSRMVIYGCQ